MNPTLLIGSLCLPLLLLAPGISMAQENRASKAWDLSVDWGKGDGKTARHILTIDGGRSGTIKDVGEGWSTSVRDLKIDESALSFRFHYGGDKEYSTRFRGKVTGKKIAGTYTVFGVKGKVTGQALDPSRMPSFQRRTSALEAYRARTFTSSDGVKVNYRLFIPPEYDTKKRYPLVLFHHGGGGAGDDNQRQLESACTRVWIQPEAQAEHACFIVAPQFPSKKAFARIERGEGGKQRDGMKLLTRAIHEILDSLEKEFAIDKNREYVTGLSFGGDCTWFSLFERPGRFAAAVPICAGYTLDASAVERASQLVRVPLWIFHGDADKVVPVQASRRMVNALRAATPEPRYTEYEGVGHDCWDRTYEDPKLIAWLFAQSKASSGKTPRRHETGSKKGR